MMHPKKISTRGTLVAMLFSCTALVPVQASAYVTQILDPSGLTELKNNVQLGMNQFKELTEMKKMAEEQLSAIGGMGQLGSLFGGSSFTNIGSESDFYTNMEKFAFDPCAINLCQTGDNPVGTTDIEEAREWVMKNLFAGRDLKLNEVEDLNEVRRRATIYTATNGVALASIIHNELAGAKEQSDALEQIVEASENLRGDVRANSAIALAAYKIELEQLAMLTAMLSVESASAIMETSIYHEDGGDTFPDAFIESDFASNDRRVRIKVTTPEQGSASGSGFGGALIQSLSGEGSSASNLFDKVTGGVEGLGSVNDIMSNISAGNLPSISPDKINLSTLTSDAAALASASLGSKADAGLKSALAQVQIGLTEGGTKGNSSAMLGIAQTIAASNGNSTLSAALNTATVAIDSGDNARAISFANGVLKDLAKQGVTGQYVSHLQNQIAAVEAGSQSADVLVLDAAAIYSARGATPDAQVSEILQIDPSSANETYFKDKLADALEILGTATGEEDLNGLADQLRNTDQEDIDALRQAVVAGSAAQGTSQASTQASSVFE